jgi:hypothetical protein
MQKQDFALCQQLFTRMCHDLAGVSGNVINYMELMRDSLNDKAAIETTIGAAEFSAKMAVARIKFFRAVMGREGPLTNGLITAEITRDYLGTTDNSVTTRTLDWQFESQAYDRLRLGALGVFVVAGALIRGGAIAVQGNETSITVQGKGKTVMVDPAPRQIMAGQETTLDPVSAPAQLLVEILTLEQGRLDWRENEDNVSLFMYF